MFDEFADKLLLAYLKFEQTITVNYNVSSVQQWKQSNICSAAAEANPFQDFLKALHNLLANYCDQLHNEKFLHD